MQNEGTKNLFDEEILALLPENSPQAPEMVPSEETPPATTPAPGTEQAAPVPADQQQPTGKRWTFTGKIYAGHKKLLDAGEHPETIKHILQGRARGCQCEECKTKRGEYLEDVLPIASPSAVQSNDAFLFELFGEEFVTTILNAPNRIAKLMLQLKKAPKDVQDLWNVSQKELATYARAKAILEKYMKLPDFKYKDVAFFGTWYFGQLGERALVTSLMLKLTEEQESKSNDKN